MSREDVITNEPSRPSPTVSSPIVGVAFTPPHSAPLSLRLAGTKRGWLTSLAYLATDFVAILGSLGLAWFCCRLLGRAPAAAPVETIGGIFLAGQWIAHAAGKLWSPVTWAPAAEFRRLTLATLATTAFVASIILASGSGSGPIWIWLISTMILSLVLLPALRSTTRQSCAQYDWWGLRVLIVGGTAQAAELYQTLTQNPACGLRPAGVLADLDRLAVNVDPATYLGPPEFLDRLASELGIETAILLLGSGAIDSGALVSQPGTRIRHWLMLPVCPGLPGLWMQVGEIAGGPAFRYSNGLLSRAACRLKRAFDLSLIVLVAIVLAPLMVGIALLIRLCSPGPIFYSHERIGRHGRRFHAWKFRTMHRDAESLLKQHLECDPALAAEWQAHHKLKRDPRVHWIGDFLRRSSLDELPQMWNVLRGEMSLVGPRPIVTAEIEKYGRDYQHYLQVSPGITGLWQVSGRNNTTYEERVAYDAYYVKNWSLWLDLYILACTVRVVLLGEGAY